MELPEVLYHAAPEEDASAIEESGRIPPDERGFVLLTAAKDAGIGGLVTKGHDHIALFRIDPQWLNSDLLEQMSAPGWYLYRGEVQGAEFIESYGPPPDVVEAMRRISREVDDLISVLPPSKQEAFLRLLIARGESTIDQAATDAAARELLADVDLDLGEEDD